MFEPDEKVGALSPEVERRLEALWPDAQQRRQVHEALASYGVEPYEQERDRVQLAILKLSNGNVAEAVSMVSAAKQDYRDVLMWAEYPEYGRATWALRPNLTKEDQARLRAIRRRDRQQYEEWLKSKK